MFNQARLQSSLQQFKFDIKAGHLLSLLQKGLIFSQVQSHVNFGDYNECLQPFYLLKPHTCKITEKIRHDNQNLVNQLNNNIVECIKRTNAVYNTELVNKNYEEIVYEPRGMNYFEKFQKLKVVEEDGGRVEVRVDGRRDAEMIVWNSQDNLVYLLTNDQFGDMTVSRIYPCTIIDQQLSTPKLLKLTSTRLIMLFDNNKIKLIQRSGSQDFLEFNLSLQQDVIEIQCNPSFDNVVAFMSRQEYVIVNLNNMQQLKRGFGMVRWRGYDEYVVVREKNCEFCSLLQENPLLTYPLYSTIPLHDPNTILISPNKTFFFITCNNNIWVYTFQKQQPLYIFDLDSQQQQIKKVTWINRNQVDYLCILTDCTVRVWQVELNAYCLKIQLGKFEIGEIVDVVALEKDNSQTYLLVLGSENLLVSDIVNQKIQRIESPANIVAMSNVGRNFVYVLTDENLYFLNGQKLAELFK